MHGKLSYNMLRLNMCKRDSLHIYVFSKKESTLETLTSQTSRFELHFQLQSDLGQGSAFPDVNLKSEARKFMNIYFTFCLLKGIFIPKTVKNLCWGIDYTV